MPILREREREREKERERDMIVLFSLTDFGERASKNKAFCIVTSLSYVLGLSKSCPPDDFFALYDPYRLYEYACITIYCAKIL